MREFEWIRRFEELLPPPPAGVVGIGDDAAVLPRGAFPMLATVDMLVEGTHFELTYMAPEELGHKALAVSLSDIAAMGGKATYALVSLGIPARLDRAFFERFYQGMRALADHFSVSVVGGNLCRARQLAVDVTVLGESPQAPWLRSTAKAGDWVAVTGNLGASAAGLEALRRWGRDARQRYPDEVRSHLTPTPRLVEATQLRESATVTAALDISDGLSSELHHLVQQSGVGICIDETHIPIRPSTRQLAQELGVDPLRWAVGGGEDYELLLTLSAPQPGVTVIGRVTEEVGVRVQRETGQVESLPPLGWDHLGERGT